MQLERIDQVHDDSLLDTDEFGNEPTGKIIGNYTLLQIIGEGGFVVVYVAYSSSEAVGRVQSHQAWD